MKKGIKKQVKPRAKKTGTEVMIREQNAPAVVEKPSTLSLANPQDVMNFGKVLKAFITTNHLSSKIGSSNYAHVDGWKFAGMNFGLTAIPHQPVPKHQRGEYIHILYSVVELVGKKNVKYQKEVPIFTGFADHQEVIKQVSGRIKVSRELVKPYFAYECSCDVIKLADQGRVSYGMGLCSNLELLKTGFDEYAVNSMSQTRSIGKGFRNLLGFVMNAAGHESTPAEEMDEVNREIQESMMTPPEKKAQPGRPFPNAKQFAQILSRVIAGTFDRKKAETVFTFTTEQESAIKIGQDARAQHEQPQPR